MIESRKNTFRGNKLTIELYEKSKQRKHGKSNKSGASSDQQNSDLNEDTIG